MTRRFGNPPAHLVRAKDQLSKAQEPSAPQPLPPGKPGRATPESLGFGPAPNPARYYFVADTGGITDPTAQEAVIAAMIEDAKTWQPYALLHGGDLVYYNGDSNQFVAQWYEPLSKFVIPKVAWAGNHDGDPDPTISDPTQTGIATFMANFCTPEPVPPPGDPDLEYGQHTLTQPYCDFTFATDNVWFSGPWSNVPSGGHLYQSQIDWLTAEVKAVPSDALWVPIIHHPCFSVDAFHGGSAYMLSTLDAIFTAAGREPDMVLAGHVHDAQFFTRTMASGKQVKYIVQGNGGYRNLHALAGDYSPGMDLGNGVVCDYADASEWGFLKLTVVMGNISGEYVGVAKDGTVTPAKYTF